MRHYTKISPTKLAKSYQDTGYFARNIRAIEVLIDQDAVRRGISPDEPWKLYDLGHGYCSYDSFDQCPQRMSYVHAIRDFIEWYCSEPRLAFNKTVVTRYRIALEQRRYAPSTINLRLAAVRRLAYEALDCGLLSPDLPRAFKGSKGRSA